MLRGEQDSRVKRDVLALLVTGPENPQPFFPSRRKMKSNPGNETDVRWLLVEWAESTRLGRTENILANHASDALIFDVLPPLQYEGADAYRKSWGDWQPETQGDGKFGFKNLLITAGDDVAFATGVIECGGTLANGHAFEDIVRATFCLTKQNDAWTIRHQHISKPMG